MEYVSALSYEQKPDYDRCRRFFQDALRNTYKLPSSDYTKAELTFTKQADSVSSASSAKGRSNKQAKQSEASSSASATPRSNDDSTPATIPKKASTSRSRTRTKKAKPAPAPEPEPDEAESEPEPSQHVRGNSHGHNLANANGFLTFDGDSNEQKPIVSRPKKSQHHRDLSEDDDSDGGKAAKASDPDWSIGVFKTPLEPVRRPARGKSSDDDEPHTSNKPARTRTARKNRSHPARKTATPHTSESESEAAALNGASIIPAVAAAAAATTSRLHSRKDALQSAADKLKRKSIATVQKGAAQRAAAQAREFHVAYDYYCTVDADVSRDSLMYALYSK